MLRRWTLWQHHVNMCIMNCHWRRKNFDWKRSLSGPKNIILLGRCSRLGSSHQSRFRSGEKASFFALVKGVLRPRLWLAVLSTEGCSQFLSGSFFVVFAPFCFLWFFGTSFHHVLATDPPVVCSGGTWAGSIACSASSKEITRDSFAGCFLPVCFLWFFEVFFRPWLCNVLQCLHGSCRTLRDRGVWSSPKEDGRHHERVRRVYFLRCVCFPLRYRC